MFTRGAGSSRRLPCVTVRQNETVHFLRRIYCGSDAVNRLSGTHLYPRIELDGHVDDWSPTSSRISKSGWVARRKAFWYVPFAPDGRPILPPLDSELDEAHRVRRENHLVSDLPRRPACLPHDLEAAPRRVVVDVRVEGVHPPLDARGLPREPHGEPAMPASGIALDPAGNLHVTGRSTDPKKSQGCTVIK